MRRNWGRALLLALATLPWLVTAALAAAAMGPALAPDPSPLELKTNSPAAAPPAPPAKANENTFEPWELVSV